MKNLLRSSFAILFALGSVLGAEKPAVLPAIDKKARHPEKVDLKLMSDDATYGYTDKNPVKVGSKDESGGPEAERAYLGTLLDASGKPVGFKRLFSGGDSPDGHVLDCYEVTTGDGTKVRLWIDMYHPENDPEKQPAPVGFYKRKH